MLEPEYIIIIAPLPHLNVKNLLRTRGQKRVNFSTSREIHSLVPPLPTNHRPLIFDGSGSTSLENFLNRPCKLGNASRPFITLLNVGRPRPPVKRQKKKHPRNRHLQYANNYTELRKTSDGETPTLPLKTPSYLASSAIPISYLSQSGKV